MSLERSTTSESESVADAKILWLGDYFGFDSYLPAGSLRYVQQISGAFWSKKSDLTSAQHAVLSLTPNILKTSEFHSGFLERLAHLEVHVLVSGCEPKSLSPEVLRVVNYFGLDQIYFLPKDLDLAAKKIQSLVALDFVENKLGRMKGLVKLINALSECGSVENIIQALRSELKVFSRVKEPILAYANHQNQLMLMYFQGSNFREKTVAGMWSQQIKIRRNDKNDSQFLANALGRPFGKLLTLPLPLNRKIKGEALNVSAVLFFEHSLGDEQWPEFLGFLEDRLHAVSISLDRILLTSDLNEMSLIWEKTFDSLQDPLAIFDDSGHLVRANRYFHERLAGVVGERLFQPTILESGRIFERHSYPISFSSFEDKKHSINYYVDVTTQVKLQKQMIQNEKMAALGQMAGHIAHELNNPLTGVRSLAQILSKSATPGTHIASDLKEVEIAAERCQSIIKNLIEFSQPGIENKKSIVSLNEIINKTLPLLKSLLSRYNVEVELTSEANDILVEPQLMQQVVFNIINNAAQAMGESGQLTIRTVIGGREKKFVQFRVKDTGVGIPKDIIPQIFDFFFTTKANEQGTGLGLSICKSIVDRYQGRIDVESEVGQGSEFIVQMPLQFR